MGEPTLMPTENPTFNPTSKPSLQPTHIPTINPTQKPSFEPSYNPTIVPTMHPTSIPTNIPTSYPTNHPSANPTASEPTYNPTLHPTSTTFEESLSETKDIFVSQRGSSKNWITQQSTYMISGGMACGVILSICIVFCLCKICGPKKRKKKEKNMTKMVKVSEDTYAQESPAIGCTVIGMEQSNDSQCGSGQEITYNV